MRQKTFKYMLPIYDMKVEIYLCEYSELPSYLRKDSKDDLSGFTCIAQKGGQSSKVCIWIEDFHWTSDNMATLVHELSHAVDRIAEYKGITLDTESRAYMLGHLVDKFFYRIGKAYK